MEKKLEMICEIIGELGEVKGRKKIQKMFHIAKSFGYPIDYEFDWGNYGAFSTELQHDLTLLYNQGFLREETIKDGDFVEYDYYPTGNCIEFIKEEGHKLPVLFSELLTVLNKKETSDLELMSSIFYLLSQGEERDRLVIFLNHLKPQFNEEIIRDAMNEIGSLKDKYTPR